MTYLYGVYGGYNLVNGESFHLAALAGYYFYHQDFTDSAAALHGIQLGRLFPDGRGQSRL